MSAATEDILDHLAAISFVAGRDARAALPAVTSLSETAVLRYLETGRDLFFYDREAGKASLLVDAGFGRTPGAPFHHKLYRRLQIWLVTLVLAAARRHPGRLLRLQGPLQTP